jgi:queuosine precursor transporter
VLFYSIAFGGLWALNDLVTVATDQYVLKTLWEVIATPLTYRIVAFLKRAEQEDYYDRDTDFTPFSLKA